MSGRSSGRLICLLALLSSAVPVSSAVAQATAPFNVRTFGASGASNCAADQAGFNAALAAVPASGGEIYIPAGKYCLTQTLTVVNKPIAFRGEGQRTSVLNWVSGGDGIAFQSTSTTINHALTIKSLSLLSNKTLGGSAVNASWAATTVGHGQFGFVSTVMTDFHIGESPLDTPGLGWDFGLWLVNVTNAKLTNFTIHAVNGNHGQAAIFIRGNSVSNYISNGDISGMARGVWMIENSEGLHVTDVEIIDVLNGIEIATSIRPGTSIASCHIASTNYGIVTNVHGDMAISNNLLYSIGFNFPYVGINVAGGDAYRITGNYIVRTGSGGTYNGIVLQGTSVRNVIANNITENMHTGIWLLNAATQNVVIGNMNRGWTVAPIVDACACNVLVNNF